MDFSNPWIIGGALLFGLIVIVAIVLSARRKKDPYAAYYDNGPYPPRREVGVAPAMGATYGSGQAGDPITEIAEEPPVETPLELTPEMEEKVEQTSSVEELLSELDKPTPGDLVRVTDTAGLYNPERFEKPLKVDLVTKHKSPQVRLVNPDTGAFVETVGMKRVRVIRK